MPQRDFIHDRVKRALIRDGWEITDDPYVISYGERFLFIDLAANQGRLIGASYDNHRIAVEIKDFRGKSPLIDLERAIGQYTLYRLLLNQVDPSRELYLAVTDVIYESLFSELIGKLVIRDLPLNLLVVDIEAVEVKQWIPASEIGKSSSK